MTRAPHAQAALGLTLFVVLSLAARALAEPAALDTIRVRATRHGIPKPQPRGQLPKLIRSVLEAPSEAEAALLKHDLYTGNHQVEDSPDPTQAFHHPARSGFRSLTTEQTERLARLILSEEFWNPGQKTCICPPTVGYVLRAGGRRLTLMVNHEAASVGLYADSVAVGRDLDHVNLDLLRLAREVFPHDSTLDALIAKEDEGNPSSLLSYGAGQWVPPDKPSNPLSAPDSVTATSAGTQTSLPGTWRGTSTCVDPEHFPACKDEQVIYEARLAHSSPDTVAIRADRVVNGTRLFMGELFFTLQADSSWVADVRTPRAHFLVTLRRAGQRLTGVMTDVPSARRIREIALELVQ